MYFFEFNKLFFLSRIFDGIEIPIGKFQIKDGDKIKLDDEEVGEVAIAKKQKFIKCKVQIPKNTMNVLMKLEFKKQE
jgi:hypothetical protein